MYYILHGIVVVNIFYTGQAAALASRQRCGGAYADGRGRGCIIYTIVYYSVDYMIYSNNSNTSANVMFYDMISHTSIISYTICSTSGCGRSHNTWYYEVLCSMDKDARCVRI